jgi:hypothetical protein
MTGSLSEQRPGRDVETAIVLPDGRIHLHGQVLGGVFVSAPTPGTTSAALALIWSCAKSAARAGRDIEVRVALPDGRLETRVVSRDSITPTSPQRHHRSRPDPRWDGPVPDRRGLRSATQSARRAGQFAAAEVAAGCLATQLRADLGLHPHAVLAVEAQAECAALAHRWRRAALLYAISTTARHHLGSPGTAEADSAEHAVTAWTQSLNEPSAASAGLSLAHTLISLCPPATDLLASVMRRLPALTAPAPHPWPHC